MEVAPSTGTTEGSKTEPPDEGAIDTAAMVSIACSADPVLVVSGFWAEASAAQVSPSVSALCGKVAIVVNRAGARDGARGGGGAMVPVCRAAAPRVRGGGGVASASGVMSTTRAYGHGRPAGQQRLFAGEGVSLQLHCQARQIGPYPGVAVSLEVQCTHEGTCRPSLQVPQASVGTSSFKRHDG